jgi:hypothetical protein
MTIDYNKLADDLQAAWKPLSEAVQAMYEPSEFSWTEEPKIKGEYTPQQVEKMQRASQHAYDAFAILRSLAREQYNAITDGDMFP